MPTAAETMPLITAQLNDAFSPTHLEIIDESHLHAGHAGAQTGKGHYVLNIHSDAFKNKPLIAKHRMIYQALGELMDTHIHALSININ